VIVKRTTEAKTKQAPSAVSGKTLFNS